MLFCYTWLMSVLSQLFFLIGPFLSSFSLFSSFLESNWQICIQNNSLPMSGFEPRIFGVGSDRSANCDTTTARKVYLFLTHLYTYDFRYGWIFTKCYAIKRLNANTVWRGSIIVQLTSCLFCLDWIQLLCWCWMNNSFTCLVKSKLVKQEDSYIEICMQYVWICVNLATFETSS